MKKNGFVSMTLVYTFLILFLFLMLAILNAYSAQNRYIDAIEENINLTIQTPNKYDYCDYVSGLEFNYDFVKGVQTFVAGCKGKYKIELWGADGGGISDNGGKGAYTSGIINLEKDTKLYIYVGEAGKYSNNCDLKSFNSNISNVCASGGGSTDIRLESGINNEEWNYYTSLSSRIMVASGGGGAAFSSGTGGNAGGFMGDKGIYNTNETKGGGKSSTHTGYSTYFGASNSLQNNTTSSGGGGGFFAGESSNSSNAAGGSSYISGHLGCIAVIRNNSSSPREVNSVVCSPNKVESECSIHYSKYQFTNTLLVDGSEKNNIYVLNNTTGNMELNKVSYTIPTKGNNSKNGYAKITYISEI